MLFTIIQESGMIRFFSDFISDFPLLKPDIYIKVYEYV